MKEEERERERSWPIEFAPETQLAPTNDGDSLEGLGREGLLCDRNNGWCRINLYRTANSVFPRLLFCGEKQPCRPATDDKGESCCNVNWTFQS